VRGGCRTGTTIDAIVATVVSPIVVKKAEWEALRERVYQRKPKRREDC
jgi:hypothetical protein